MCSTQVPETGEHFSIKFYENSRFLIFTFVVFMVTLITLFYKDKRLMQIRLCILNSLLLTGYQIWIAVAYIKIHKMYSYYTISFGSLIPLISIILLIVAARLILRDEARHAFERTFDKKKEQ